MDSREIREIIELISRSCFSTFEFEGEGFRLKLVKDAPTNAAAAPVVPGAAAESVSGGAVPIAPGTAPAPTGAPGAAAPAGPVQAAVASDLTPLRSPIVGTFYASSSPTNPPFVEIGARVKQGQVVCIVEAMKVMNEIEAEIDAEIVEVPVKNGQPVEYGEVLFLMRPLG